MPAVLQTRKLEKTFTSPVRAPGLRGYWSTLLRPSYREVAAVRGLDLEVAEGESLGLIGPNGAGKSTTLKMLTGILHPSAGEATVLGLVPWKERTRLSLNIATVFGQRSQLWFHLPPLDTFELLRRIYELPSAEYRQHRDNLIERLGLAPFLHTPVRKLSLGQRMRCEIAASLLHRPRILFLDEPTIGLDVIAKQEIRAVVRELNREQGVAVLLTSHDAGDLEHLCRRVVVINHGTVVFDDGVSALRRRYLKRKVIDLKLSDTVTALPELPGVQLLTSSSFGLKLEVDTTKQPIGPLIGRLTSELSISDITIEDPPMEEIIAAIYGDAPPDRKEAVS